MSRMYRFATIGIIWILAIFIHYFAGVLFAPGTEVYALGDVGVGMYIDADWQDNMYTVFAQYIPLLFLGLSFIWGFAKEYESALHTGRVR